MFIHYLVVCATLLMSSIPVCQSVIYMPSKKQIEQKKINQPTTTEFQDELQAQKQPKHTLKKGAHAAPEDSDEDGPDVFDMLFTQKKSATKRPVTPALPWYQRAWNFAKESYNFLDSVCTFDQEMSVLERDKEYVSKLSDGSQKTALQVSIDQRDLTIGKSFSDRLGAFVLDKGIDMGRRQVYEYVTGDPDFHLVDSALNVVSTIRKLAPDPQTKFMCSAAKRAALRFEGHAQSRIQETTNGVGTWMGSFLHNRILKPFVFDKVRGMLQKFGGSSELARGFMQRFLLSEGVRNLVKTHVLKTENDSHPLLLAMKHADLGLFGYRTYKIISQMKNKTYGFDLSKIAQAVMKGQLSIYSLKSLMYEMCGLSIDLASLLEKHMPENNVEAQAAPDGTAKSTKNETLVLVIRKTLSASKFFLEGLRGFVANFDKSCDGFGFLQDFVEAQRESA